MYLVPLQCQFYRFRFRKSTMGLPTFILIMCVGNPEGVNLFRNSTGYNLSLFKVLQLLYSFLIPGNEVIIMLFISSTALLIGAIMVTFAWHEVIEFDI